MFIIIFCCCKKEKKKKKKIHSTSIVKRGQVYNCLNKLLKKGLSKINGHVRFKSATAKKLFCNSEKQIKMIMII